MNHTEFTRRFAQKMSLSNAEAKIVIEAFVESVQEGISESDKVTVNGLGHFKKVFRPERQGRNPKKNVAITVAAKNVVKFDPKQELKDAANG